MAAWAGFSDEELRKVKQISTKGSGQIKQSNLQRKEPGRDKKRLMHVSETVTSNSPIDPAMKLKVTPQSHGDSQFPSHRIPKEKPAVRLSPADGDKHTSNSHDSKVQEEASDVTVKTEVPDASELNDTEALSRDMKSLEKFREQQKAIEEANKQKKALLSKTLSERRKKAQAEAHKLEHIQKELAKLDNLLTADVQVIRDKIEGASRDFLEAQKRFQKAEAEYIEAKMDLHTKSELKEQLTEHLYTIIHQNEVRKAKKLAQLMQELEMESGEEDFQLPELPPLSSFQQINPGPLSPSKIVHPATQNSPKTSQSEHKGEVAETNLEISHSENPNSDKNSVTSGDQNPSSKTLSATSEQTAVSPSPEQNSNEVSNEKNSASSQSEQKLAENEQSEKPGYETESLNQKSPGQSCVKSDENSLEERPSSIKVGQISQYVRDRKAQVTEELETVQNLIKETESSDTGQTVEEHNEQTKTPSSWDFSGEINSIGAKDKS